jgi:hypothetical protein
MVYENKDDIIVLGGHMVEIVMAMNERGYRE